MSPGPELFAQTLHCTIVAGGLRLKPDEFAKILGLMIFRSAPLPQIRVFLNTALPKGTNPIPAIPSGLTAEEAEQLFRDDRAEVREDQDEPPAEDDEDDEEQQGHPPTAITMQKCKGRPALNGRYTICVELSAPGRPVYEKESSKDPAPVDLDDDVVDLDSDDNAKPTARSEQKDPNRIMVRYRERSFGGVEAGWAISRGVRGEVLATNPREARSPPCFGWLVFKSDGSKEEDTGGFMHKQVGTNPRKSATSVIRGTGPSASSSGGASASSGSRKDKIDPRLARSSLERLDLSKLTGSIRCGDRWVSEYFGHFVALAHLEHLADVAAIKKRRERSTADQLVRWGWALSGMRMLNTFGKKEPAAQRGRLLPGWEDQGVEMAALQLPMGYNDMDRLRLRRGDSVTVSLTDPLADKLGEGAIHDIRPGTIIVQLRGNFPKDCRDKLWRLDKAANITVYERQMLALLQLTLAAKTQATVELLTVAPVGLADRWAIRWQKKDNRQDSGDKARDSRNSSGKQGQPAKRKQSRSRSRSGGKKRDKGKDGDGGNASDSESSTERDRKKRQSRCRELAEGEIEETFREEKLKAARAKVSEIPNMNASQRNAIDAALRQTCTVVQGPPGTGKTHVSVQTLHYWTKELGLKPVLATSDSNVAVDNICEGLRARGVKAVRVGRPEKVRGVIEDMTLEAELKRLKLEQAAEGEGGEDEDGKKHGLKAGGKTGPCGKSAGKGPVFGKMGMGMPAFGEDLGEAAMRNFEDKRAQSRQDFELQMKILRESEVICTTTIAAGMEFLSRLSNFEGILVDEVAQATELSTVVPVILRGAQRLVLVGDHCQLPPAVVSPEAEVRGLSLSVYSRLIQAGGMKPFMLDTQYRSHPKLAEFSSKAFYDGMLLSGVEESKRPLPLGVPWPNKNCPIAFIEVESQEEMEGDSKANSVEAQMVAHLVGKVFQYGELSIGEVGVVTPYMAQVRKLRQLLRPHLPPGADQRMLECSSVDNFQGREKELIVFSAVRSNRAGNVGFLADWRRLNVMLTRARRGLLIFGNSATLRHDPIWEKWLDFAKEHKCIVDDMPIPAPAYPPAKGMAWQQQQSQPMWQMKGAASGFGKGVQPRITPPQAQGARPPMAGFKGLLGKAAQAIQVVQAAREVAFARESAANSEAKNAMKQKLAEALQSRLQQKAQERGEASRNFAPPAAFAQKGSQPLRPLLHTPRLQLSRPSQEQINSMESQLNLQWQQLARKKEQVMYLCMSNPLQATMQFQQLQQEERQLEHRWNLLEENKRMLHQPQQYQEESQEHQERGQQEFEQQEQEQQQQQQQQQQQLEQDKFQQMSLLEQLEQRDTEERERREREQQQERAEQSQPSMEQLAEQSQLNMQRMVQNQMQAAEMQWQMHSHQLNQQQETQQQQDAPVDQKQAEPSEADLHQLLEDSLEQSLQRASAP
eukprot:TRINITY_DN6550_c0_g1_i1.p1 TRINITY_DN6550_c0_g1~~TRINITY_DN6550_c0_g1_i1.p1  ORF type:complete len:1621 (-),score=390.88 TRINITY_DN6550_c0_g1_i1:199-4500(-)